MRRRCDIWSLADADALLDPFGPEYRISKRGRHFFVVLDRPHPKGLGWTLTQAHTTPLSAVNQFFIDGGPLSESEINEMLAGAST